MNVKLIGTLTVCVISLAANLFAANVHNVVWDGALTTQFEADQFEVESQQIMASGFGDGMPMPSITADFGADKGFQINLSAQGGQKIYFNPPTFPNTTGLQGEFVVEVSSGNGLMNGLFVPGTFDGFTFTGLEGAAPTLQGGNFSFASSSFVGGTNPQFSAFAVFDFTAPFSFTGLQLDFTAPGSMNTVFSGANNIGNISAEWEGEVLSGIPAEPAAWVTLTAFQNSAVPEPSTLALFVGLGWFAAARAVRRRQRS